MTGGTRRPCRKDERGNILILTLILVFLGSLILPPLLSYLHTGIKTCEIYEEKTRAIYAADSGIEEATWRIKYGDLEETFTSPPYDVYDFASVWSYQLSEEVNHLPVSVSIQNVWIPSDTPKPDKDTARAIIESGKLMVVGNAPTASSYEIEIVFHRDEGESLNIESIGVWLSPGFDYVPESSNIDEPTVELHAGGKTFFTEFQSST